MFVEDTVYQGRPEGAELAEVEEASYALLEELGVPFTCVLHEEAHTIEDCEKVEKLLGVSICKNLFLTNAQKTNFFLLVMPGNKAFKTKNLSQQIGSARLSFAGPGHMMEYLGIAPGSVSVLALMNDQEKRVRLLIDRDIAKEEMFGCHPCKNTASLKMRTADLLEKVLPAMGREPEFVEL